MNKYRITIFVTASILVILLLACAPAAKPGATVTVTCDQFSKQANIVQDVTATVGSTITVTLCSNPTTGFQWDEQAQISDKQVLKQTSNKMVAPANTGMAGAPGNQVWTFEALKAGAGTASFSYSRPWAGGEKGVETFKLNVTVQ
ncbi:MAG: protease inhibitor I42 family protein [Chloroflexi bacterium]|nr:protease inhibitor I42 family protein [Chloroflexota bacterium]